MACVAPNSGCTADGGAPWSHRTGRKEKPHQDNRKKPKRAKFHHNHFRLCKRKAVKGLQGKNCAELFGIKEAESFRALNIRGRQKARSPLAVVLTLGRPLVRHSF